MSFQVGLLQGVATTRAEANVGSRKWNVMTNQICTIQDCRDLHIYVYMSLDVHGCLVERVSGGACTYKQFPGKPAAEVSYTFL